jgi:signal transduction histidine kinase
MGIFSKKKNESEIIDILGHELRTPATVIKLNTQLLEKFSEQIKEEREEYDKYLSRINRAIEEQLKLMDTLLLSSGIEGNNIVLNLEKVNILERIKLSISAFEKEAKEKGIEIVEKVDPNTPDILADKTSILEILNNLIGNAVKFTQKGSITIETFFDKDYVSYRYRDWDKGGGYP